jgi:glycosyltransferase involved in cell wall biosynthesis
MTTEVCVVTPYPPGRKELGGGGWVDRRLLESLRASGTTVDLVTVTGPDGEWHEHGYHGVSAGSVPLEMRSDRAALARVALGMLVSTEPYLARKFTVFDGWSQAVELLRARAAGKPVLTSGWPSLLLARAAGVTVSAHIAHNVESVIADEHSPTALRLLGERVRLRRAERRLLRLPKRVFALSRTDAAVLRTWGAAAEPLPIPVIPQTESLIERPNTVGFIGKASWPPNASALRALLGPVHEELLRLGSDVQFVLAGRGTEEFAGHPRVISSGWVADEADFYARTGLVVVPRFGVSTGISVKMIEAAEFGVPALVPRALADAVDPDGPWLVADEPAAIAEGIAKWSCSGRGSDVRDWVSRNDPARTGAMLTSVLTSRVTF